MDQLVGHFSGKLTRCHGALWFVVGESARCPPDFV
jgi:hypothetical protein